jgi:alkanesulfonate monooxygenase SsuD/methylene tetrahydromethanopterin reductase-like flavin-dependent oxidoreductase (luciferase family)
MKSGRVINQATATIPELVDANIVFAGNPDQVAEQITEFCDHVGGIGNLIMMCHGGSLSHADAMENLRLFAKEVMPRLKDRFKTPTASAAAE